MNIQSSEGVMLSLNCWVIGERGDSVFTVKIESYENVSILKDLIREKKRPRFDSIAANELILFQIEVHSDDFNKTLKEVKLPSDVEHATNLGPTIKLSKFFKREPLEEHIHIMVVKPEGNLFRPINRYLTDLFNSFSSPLCPLSASYFCHVVSNYLTTLIISPLFCLTSRTSVDNNFFTISSRIHSPSCHDSQLQHLAW
jgi:hypothetical protein